MSTFTQFTGGAAPVGSFIPTSGAFGVNFTSNGAEYLQTGYLKAYSASYASLVGASKTLGSKNTPPTSTSFVINQNYYDAVGGATMMAYTSGGTTNYYPWCAYNSGPAGPGYSNTTVTWSTSTTSAPTAISFPSSIGTMYLGDIVIFNNRLLAIWNYYSTSTTGYDALYNVIGGTASLIQIINNGTGDVSGYKLVASPSLCVLIGNDLQTGGGGSKSGNIYTSTDGVTWTARTNSITLSGTIQRAEYFASANLFIFVTNTGAIYTSPNGYTLTLRTSPAGMSSPGYSNGQYYKNYSTNITNLAMIWVGGTQLLYTTDGINYSISTVNDYSQNPLLYNVMPASGPYVLGTDGTRILLGQVGSNYLAYTTTGINFVLDFRRTGYVSYGFSNLNYGPRVSGFSKIGATTYIISEFRGYGNYVLDATGSIATSTPDLVGQQAAFTWASGSSLNTYLRIA